MKLNYLLAFSTLINRGTFEFWFWTYQAGSVFEMGVFGYRVKICIQVPILCECMRNGKNRNRSQFLVYAICSTRTNRIGLFFVCECGWIKACIDEKRWFSWFRKRCLITFLLGLCSTFDGVAGSSTGLVLRLFENFLRFRFKAANAPNPSLFAFVAQWNVGK